MPEKEGIYVPYNFPKYYFPKIRHKTEYYMIKLAGIKMIMYKENTDEVFRDEI